MTSGLSLRVSCRTIALLNVKNITSTKTNRAGVAFQPPLTLKC